MQVALQILHGNWPVGTAQRPEAPSPALSVPCLAWRSCDNFLPATKWPKWLARDRFVGDPLADWFLSAGDLKSGCGVEGPGGEKKVEKMFWTH